ncbi:MAG: hypothetical protein JO061_17460 [Acidobacteriaceae bacterium]|nr:hypothetical protein [Acidobacteriaceae bacterium]
MKHVVRCTACLVSGLILIGISARSPAWAQESGATSSEKQQAAETGAPRGENPVESSPKRIFGIIPNYRTFPSLEHYEPLTTPQKFKIASQDTFDRGTFILAVFFGGQSDLARSNPSFGDGAPAFAKYFATSYADFAIGNFMTEAIYPSLLHQDPRYFRRGTGRSLSRIGYATQQIFWTHMDGGGERFNYSEIVGNATAVAISNAYYEESRTASDAVVKLGTQVAVDWAANVLKEFSPDIYRKFRHKRNKE